LFSISIVLLIVCSGIKNVNTIWRVGFGLASLLVFGWGCHTGHGIVSSSLPFLN